MMLLDQHRPVSMPYAKTWFELRFEIKRKVPTGPSRELPKVMFRVPTWNVGSCRDPIRIRFGCFFGSLNDPKPHVWIFKTSETDLLDFRHGGRFYVPKTSGSDPWNQLEIFSSCGRMERS